MPDEVIAILAAIFGFFALIGGLLAVARKEATWAEACGVFVPLMGATTLISLQFSVPSVPCSPLISGEMILASIGWRNMIKWFKRSIPERRAKAIAKRERIINELKLRGKTSVIIPFNMKNGTMFPNW